MINYHGIEVSEHEFSWLSCVNDIFVYPPSKSEQKTIILSPSSPENYARGIIDLCNFGKYNFNQFATERSECIGYFIIDIKHTYDVKKVEYIWATNLKQLQRTEIMTTEWVENMNIKNELTDYLLKGLFASSQNRDLVPIWVRWLDHKKYSLFMHLFTR